METKMIARKIQRMTVQAIFHGFPACSDSRSLAAVKKPHREHNDASRTVSRVSTVFENVVIERCGRQRCCDRQMVVIEKCRPAVAHNRA